MAFPFLPFPPFPPAPPAPPTPPSGPYYGPPRYNNAPTAATDSDATANSVAEGAAANTLVGITAHSTDAEQTVTYALGSDSSGGGFKIDPTTGVVTVADPSRINFETAPGHAYTITVNSSDGISVTPQSFTINVTDIAPSIPVDSNAAANTVAEGAAANTLVGITASSTDINGPGVTYSLSNDANGAFKIDAATGVVSVADPSKIDFESTAPGHVLNITVVASDGTLSNSQNFTINVSDVALTAPVDGNAAANSVAEGAANGSAVGVTAVAVDPNGPATTYSLTADSSLGGFTINATTGVVTIADSTKIDFESAAGHAYSVTVQATNGVQTTSQAFSIAVADVAPSAPVDSNAGANTVAEGAANGSTVGVTAASSDVNGGTVTYSLTGDTSGGGFTINAATGVITVADSTKIDYETAAGHAYTVTAQASDGTLTNSQTFTIGVSDVAPSTPVDSNGGANTIAEGAINGSTVGITASSTDVNGPGVTYSLVGDTSGGGFTINASTGIVTVADATKIDYETPAGHAYNITVRASDGTLFNQQNFVINVADVAPSAPVDSDGGANTIAEGAANNSTVGVTASSSDVNGPAVSYSLTADSSLGGFTINAVTGVITVADATKIDYETAPGHAYTVTAQASDGSLTNSQIFTIAVTDAAPSTPVDSNAGANTIAEGAANGSTVGVTVSSTDVNGPAVTYSLIADTSGGAFTINAATGVVTVADSTRIDFENSGGSYAVTAQASDGTLTNSQIFTIAVSDVAPSAPVDSNAGANTVVEGAANGSTVGITASSTDVNGPGVTYSLVGDTSGGGFTINASTGIVTVADATKIDYETPAGHAYNITVQASDGTLTSSQVFAIAVSDVAPSTPVDSNGGANTITEGAANGSTVGVTVSSTDVNGPAVTYSLIADTSGGGFTINAANGTITVADSTKINYETAAGHAYTVTAQASDGTLSTSQVFTIGVTDVAPSTPVDSDGGANQVVVGSAPGATVGVTASSTDVNGPAVTYSLVNDTSGGGFTINAATGVVTVADPSKILLADPSYDITVESSDGTLPSSQQTFTVAVITNVPPAIDSDGSGTTAAKSAAENQTAVTTVHANDPDNGPTVPVTYSIVGGDDQLKFAINSTTGVLTFISAPDFENPADTATSGSNTYIVTVRAFDGASSDDQTITVTVTDVNDAPVVTSNGGGATASINVNENSTAVTTVTSTDQDSPPQTLTYSLAGGADSGKFSIDPGTGVLTFITAPNFEVPTDNGGGNDYDVIVRVTDNGAGTLHDDQAITVHVQNVNEAPDTGASTVTGNEDATSIAITINGSDVDGGDSVASFHITGVPGGAQGVLYSDAGLTTVVTEGADVAVTAANAATLYFKPAANFNGPVTFNAAATDSHGLTDATPATETINITAVNDAPVNNGVPAQFTVMSGFTHAITGLSVTDIDANGANDITTTLTSAAGSVNVGAVGGGAAIAGNGTGIVTLTGTIAEINASLGGSVVYTAADGVASSTTTTLTIATNDHGHTGAPGAITDTDVITVGVTPQVWFINQDQTGADTNAPRGSQTNPFTDVHEFNISSGPGTNDYIYVKAGTYTGEGINLKDGQTLLGDDQALSLADPFGGPAIVIETAAGARPTINVTTAGDQGIDLAQNNTIHGINITTAAGTTGLDDGQGGGGNAVGSLTVDHMTISGAGQAVDIDQGGALNVSLDSVSSTAGAFGIELGGALTGTFTATTGALSGHTTSEFSVNGGTGNISYGGSIGNGSGLSASVASHTAGTVTLSGAITDSNDAGGGVSLTSNTGGTINFTGGMTLDTGTSNGFVATGGGTVNVTGTNHITSTTGTALNITNTTIGASNVTFQDISSNGGTAPGIVLDTTGSSGGLHLTGNGANVGATGGGVIANKTGADGTNNGIGIVLNNTKDVQLNGLQMNDFQNFAISGNNVNGFTLDHTTINGTNGTLQGGLGEGDVYFTGLSGSASVSNSNFSGAAYDTFHVFNNGETLNRLTITNSNFAMTNTSGNDAIGLQATGGTFNVTVQGSHITSARSDLFQLNLLGTVSSDLVFGGASAALGNTLTNNNTNIVSGGGGVTIGGGGPANNVTLTYDISHNSISGSHGAVLAVTKGTGPGGSFTGIIDSNVIGTQGVAGSGSTQGEGIAVYQDGAGASSTTITNNHISGVVAGRGAIDLLLRNGGAGTMSAIVQGNTIDTLDQVNSGAGIYAQTGSNTTNSPTPDNNKSNLTIGGAGALANHIDVGTNAGGAIIAGIIVEQEGNSRVGLIGSPNYGGTPYNFAAVQTYVGGNNVVTGNAPAVFAFGDPNQPGGFGYFGGAQFLFAESGGVQAATPTSGEMHLTQAQLDSVVTAAIAQWAAAGASASQLAMLHATTFSVADLSGSIVGEEKSPAHITIDTDAAGHGWFVDSTPFDNFEFRHAANAAGTDLYTDATSAAAGHLDLLTTVSHEMGHVLGLDDSTSPADAGRLMFINLADGERRLPDAVDVAHTPTTSLTPTVSVGPAGNPGNATVDAGHGFVFGGGANGFVFANAGFPAAPSVLTPPAAPAAPPAVPGFAPFDGGHAGDAFNVASHAAVDFTPFHTGWLV